MARKFNIAGPMMPQRHYCIPPLSRIDLEEILELVDDLKYFVLHAPRQTGKTSTLQALADALNSTGQYACLYVNLEAAEIHGQEVDGAMRTVLSQLALRAKLTLQDEFVAKTWKRSLRDDGGGSALNVTLAHWALAASQPLVLLIDEIDKLQGDSLLAVLRQVRAGYDLRPHAFPHSVILCGVRDVRDYLVHSQSAGGRVNTGSAFNIKAESLRLGDFTHDEVRQLLGQHTAATGQPFEPRALQRIWELTAGQPWLVNALAYQACFKDKAGRDRDRPVTAGAVERAKEALIRQRVTHLDQLANTLSEPRVRRVIEPLLDGHIEPEASDEDLLYVRDLGLIARDDPVRMANPIYAEVVPRQLTSVLQARLATILPAPSYVRPDGSLDLDRLMQRFQGFFRDHSEHWVTRFGYFEAGPQLILQAALQTVVNSGGRIEREYGLGRRRTDLLVVWHRPDGRQVRYVIECQVMRRGRGLDSVVARGVRQTAEYMDASGAEGGHLAVFDLREGRTWRQRLFRRQESAGQRTVTVWGV